MEPASSRSWSPSRPWSIVVDLVVALGVLLALLVCRADPLSLGSDPWIYQHMAEDPLGYLPLAPFGYRVLTPLLVSVLPLPVPMGFTLVSWAGLAGAALVVRRTATALSSPARGLAAMVLLLGSGLCLQVIRVPYVTDPLTLALGAGALELGRRRRWVAVAVLLTIGAANRETALFLLLPLAAWAVAGHGWSWRSGRIVAALAAGPALVTAVLRWTPLLYGETVPARVQTPGQVLAFNADHAGGAGGYLLLAAVSATGVLVPVLIANRTRIRGYLAASLLFVVPNALAVLGATDWPRVLGPSILVLAPAAAVVVPRRPLSALLVANPLVCAAALALT